MADFCGNCGNALNGQKFCGNCGTPAGAQPQAQQQPLGNVSSTSFAPVMEFKSHISGKNADVIIYENRIEWRREGSKVARVVGAAATVGLSLLAGKKDETETIPIKQISHVATKRDGLLNTKVVITTSGGNIEMRCDHDTAARAKDAILKCMMAL